jgi:hypothetical protein
VVLMVLLGAGCTQAVAVAPPTVLQVPTPTVLVRPISTVTPLLAATSTPPPARLQTFHAQISFDTYETEETVQSQLGRLPGVASIAVTQLDVTVQYDPTRLTEDDILRTLRANPEVRIKDENRAGQ